jgi:hypothetical protein
MLHISGAPRRPPRVLAIAAEAASIISCVMVLDLAILLLRDEGASGVRDCRPVLELHCAAAQKSVTRTGMEPREFISVAAFAIASALAAFGMWLVVIASVSDPLELGDSLMQNLAVVLHPGVWYVLAALAFRQIGRSVSK